MKERREALWLSCLPGAIRYDTDRVKSSPSDKFPERFAEIDEIDRRIVELTTRRQELLRSLYLRMIDETPCCREMAFLHRYYLDGQSMGFIAERFGVTYQHCFRIRRKAVELFAELATKEGWEFDV